MPCYCRAWSRAVVSCFGKALHFASPECMTTSSRCHLEGHSQRLLASVLLLLLLLPVLTQQSYYASTQEADCMSSAHNQHARKLSGLNPFHHDVTLLLHVSTRATCGLCACIPCHHGQGEYLWSHVVKCATPAEGELLIKPNGKAKVPQLELAQAREEYVFWLDVSVKQHHAVALLQDTQQRGDDLGVPQPSKPALDFCDLARMRWWQSWPILIKLVLFELPNWHCQNCCTSHASCCCLSATTVCEASVTAVCWNCL